MEERITFTLVYENRMYPVTTWENEYDSLMCLISDNFPASNFGICYGGGSCGTCGIRIKENAAAPGTFVPSCEIKIDTRLSDKIIHRL